MYIVLSTSKYFRIRIEGDAEILQRCYSELGYYGFGMTGEEGKKELVFMARNISQVLGNQVDVLEKSGRYFLLVINGVNGEK